MFVAICVKVEALAARSRAWCFWSGFSSVTGSVLVGYYLFAVISGGHLDMVEELVWNRGAPIDETLRTEKKN